MELHKPARTPMEESASMFYRRCLKCFKGMLSLAKRPTHKISCIQTNFIVLDY